LIFFFLCHAFNRCWIPDLSCWSSSIALRIYGKLLPQAEHYMWCA
jgi:hypothetical protein